LSSAKIKVLHIIKSLGRGGAEMLLPETLKLHDQARFEFHYIYFLPWKDQMVEAIRENGGVITCFSATNNLQIILRCRAIVRYIKENNINLVHCHLPWAGFAGRLIHKLIGIPMLYTEHNKQERYHQITRLLNRITFNWQTISIAVSSDVAESIRKNIRVRIPVIEILNGVNTKNFTRDKRAGLELRDQLNIPAQSIVVGTVAVFRFQKRLKEWLEVFAKAAAVYDTLYGIIVGDGPLKEELVAYRRQLGLEDRVFMPGLQTEVRPWLSTMDIYMMTSVFEGLPIALLEAMSMECAVVTTDAGGINEVIQHNKNGLMMPVQDWRKLEAELISLIERSGARQLLSRAARMRVVESFGMERMVGALEECYIKTSGSRS
jgi:glycosyltransferase involved in cell wall biosynthesis